MTQPSVPPIGLKVEEAMTREASFTSVYILETGLVQNAPSASLSPALWMLSSCHKLVMDAVPYTIYP